MIVESISLVNAKTQIRLIFSSKADGSSFKGRLPSESA